MNCRIRIYRVGVRVGTRFIAAARAGMRKAKAALARKLAVILHRMLADGTAFAPDRAASGSG